MYLLNKFIKVIFRSLPTYKVTPTIVELKHEALLSGRTALITGGTSGIGKEIAKSFAKAGATVIITGRDQKKTSNVAEELNNELGKPLIYGIALDVAKVQCIKRTFEEALKIVPNHSIDILVNNAGVSGDNCPTTSEEQYDRILDTNLKGVYFASQVISHYFKDNKIKGNILNIASSSSLRPANSAYGISKWGVRGLTEGMARCLAPYDITVNGIAPGPTATPMMMPDGNVENLAHSRNLIGRYIMPIEIANMAVILVSEMGRSIVGDIVYMTGGSGNITNEDMNYVF